MRMMSGQAPTFLKEAEVEQRVLQLVKSFGKVDGKNVTRQSHFINDLGLDSLDEVELLLAAEDEFSLEIPDADAEKIHSVDDLIRYLCAQPNAK
jgi:NADH dehydrogenase (ubiquinone) 1 alpha/beta subcomplex 1